MILSPKVAAELPITQPLPQPYLDILTAECKEAGVDLPTTIGVKYTDVGGDAYLGGITSYRANTTMIGRFIQGTRWDEGEVAVIVGQVAWSYLNKGTKSIPYQNLESEMLATVLHETVHWIRKDEESESHSPEYYAHLTPLILKYGIDLKVYLDIEWPYMGDKVIHGLEIYDREFNG